MLVAQAALPSSESCALAIVPRSSQIVEKAPASSDAELIVTPAKTRVRRTKSDLPSAEKSVTDQIVQCQSCEPTTVLASYAEHGLLCRLSPNECAYCYWANSGASIQEQIKQNTGAASVIVAKQVVGLNTGAFAVGCTTCRYHAGDRAFAEFRISSIASMRLNKLLRHISSPGHQSALQRERAGEQPIDPMQKGKEFVNPGIPICDKFIWNIAEGFAGGQGFRAWSRRAGNSADGTTVVRDCSKRMAKQLTTCTAVAVERKDQALLRSSVRLAFAVDDKSPNFLLRIKGVVTSPRAETFAFMGAIIREINEDANGNRQKILSAFEQMCTVRVGRRGPDGTTGCASC